MDYLEQLNKIIKENSGTADFVTVINKDYIIEYIGNLNDASIDLKKTFSEVLTGKNVLDAYSTTLTRETSSVVKAIETAKPVSMEDQRLSSGNISFSSDITTYPLFDEDGNVQGVAEVSKLRYFVNESNEQDPKESEILDSIITQNAVMKDIKSRLPGIAGSDSAVLIYGETGTGKEVFAKAIHDLSSRSTKPFISQNCAAIPENLIESHFFGSEKGSYTGAEKRKGIFELADGGTLFLDEINSMSLPMQSKLLRVLEDHKVRRIGSEKEVSVDVRIICASNEDPERLVESGRMRSDFYYRISVSDITIPPLRDRKDDIILLTEHFINQLCQLKGKEITGISQMTKDLLLEWSWPGNVRELRSVVESAINLENSHIINLNSVINLFKKSSDGEAQAGINGSGAQEKEENAAELLGAVSAPGDSAGKDNKPLDQLLEEYEKSLITQALSNHRKLANAARSLGISPQSLNYKIHKYNIDVS